MNAFLLNRQLGSVSPQALAQAQSQRLLQSLQADSSVTFQLDTSELQSGEDAVVDRLHSSVDCPTRGGRSAHAAGINSIAIDRWEGRYLLSAGSDSSVAIWDLEGEAASPTGKAAHTPLEYASRTSATGSLGITHISFFIDSLAFITSGYDGTVKVFSSETLKASASFDLGGTVHSHATSTTGSHLLVACASAHPAVRLVDLQSGSSAHALAGHSGSVLTVAWHPKDPNILASGATDGTIRLWDIRRSASSLGVLDMDDNIGIPGYDGKGTGARRRERGRAHVGAVNSIVWSEDGRHLVSSGTDEKMRVWNMSTGANTLANFGPTLKNSQNTVLLPVLAPAHLESAGKTTVFYPNPQEVLVFDLHTGTLRHRLRVTAPPAAETAVAAFAPAIRNLKNTTTSLAWRPHSMELYSAHSDGRIRCYSPRTWEDQAADDDDVDDGMDFAVETQAERKRKREELDDIVKDLMGKKVTYS
ncbi:hypothetical protein LTR95_002716 [Oleoguttula sp. CCFEE 5521]